MEKWNKVFKWGVIALASLGAVFFIILPLKEIFLRICCAGVVGLAIYYFVQFEKTSVEKIKSRPALARLKKISRLLIPAAQKIKSRVLGLNFKKITPSVFLTCLAIIVLISLEKTFSEWQAIPVIGFISKIIIGLKSINTPLIILVIISGFFTFFLNKEKIRAIEEEKTDESLVEQKRKDEFPRKYPKTNKIPLLRNFIRWMYKEKWKYSVALIAIILTGFILRIYNLGEMNLLVEEQFHYTPAVSLLSESQPKMFYTSAEYFGYVNYYRTFAYTATTALIFKVFGVNEFNLRILAVFLSTLTIVILYFLAKDLFNKKAALASSLLFSLSGWAIWYGRYARHYVFDGLILMLIIWFSYLALFKHKDTKRLYLLLIPLSLIPWVETGNYLYVLIVAIILLITLPKKELWRLLKNWHCYLIAVISLLSLAIFYYTSSNYYITPPTQTATVEQSITNKIFNLPNQFINNLFPLKYENYSLKLIWGFYPLLVIFGVLTLIFLLINIKNRRQSLLFTMPLILLIMSFYDPSKTWPYEQYWVWEPRHFSPLLPLYLLFCGIGVYLLINLYNRKWVKFFVLTIAILSILPLKLYQIGYNKNVSNTPYQVMTSESAYTEIKNPILYIKDNFNEQTDKVIFSTLEVMYRAYWDKEPDLRIGWDINSDKNLKESNVNNIMVDNPDALKELLQKNIGQSKRTWLIESNYNSINYHGRTREGKIREFLEADGQKCKVYSKNLTNIYLFTSDCF